MRARALQAREEYDDALSSGQQAFLLEESEQSPDIFSVSLGGLPAGESASLRLEYVTELPVQADESLRFCLPAVLNPRYQPQGRNQRASESLQTSGPQVEVGGGVLLIAEIVLHIFNTGDVAIMKCLMSRTGRMGL